MKSNHLLTELTVPPTTQRRIIDESLRLFGEQGFAGTSVAQIERASGLSPGSGALYRHFRSKDELLLKAVEARLSDRADWAPFLAEDFSVKAVIETLAPGRSLVQQLVVLCRIGMDRLDHDRDINRLLMRDNSIDPAVLEVFRREEYELITTVVEKALRELGSDSSMDDDWRVVAAVLVGAIVHYWLISDVYGGAHPLAIDPDTYFHAAASLVAARLTSEDDRSTEREREQ